MTLRIERVSRGGKTTLRVSGRIGLEHLAELRLQAEGLGAGTVLDLEHVTLVDVEGVRFLGECQAQGFELLHCSPYIEEWISRERRK
jgi:hypothetical protein